MYGEDDNIHRSCPLCDTDNRAQDSSSFSKNGWVIKQCLNCNFVYLENPPPYKEFEEKYAWEKTFLTESNYRRERNPLIYWCSSIVKKFRSNYLKRNKLINLINQYFNPGNVLDIGCGQGSGLAGLNAKYKPYGVEISKLSAYKAHQLVASRGGMVLHNNAIDGLSIFDVNYFVGVIMSAFLEHEIHPLDLLKNVLRVLKPKGVAIIKVPNFGSLNRIVQGAKWCGFRFPDHVNYWTPSTLKKILEGVGFQIIRFNLFDRLPTSDNMWIVVCKP